MAKFSLLFPVPAGKADAEVKSIAAMFMKDPAAYRQSRNAAGVTLERAYLQKTPMGNFVVAYQETAGDFVETMGKLLASSLDVDKRFVDMVKSIHGIDLRQPPAGPPPETAAEWSDERVPARGRGMAFTGPLAPGKTEAGRAFAKVAFEHRRAEFAESRRALGQRAEVITLQSTPIGDVINVYLEGNDPQDANRRFAASNSPFDVWFKGQLKEIFAPFVNFDQPVAGVEEFFDSEGLRKT